MPHNRMRARGAFLAVAMTIAVAITPTDAAPPWAAQQSKQVDAALFEGNFTKAFEFEMKDVRDFYVQHNDVRQWRAQMPRSALLRAAQTTEGWVVHLSRWLLEAAATGTSQKGPLEDMLALCREPFGFDALVDYARATGHVSRAAVLAGIERCMAEQGVLARVLERDPGFTAGDGDGGGGRAVGLDATNRYRWHPLHFAAAAGNIGLVRVLLHLGASVDARNGLNQTALHVAVGNGFHEVAALLVAGGADRRAKDQQGASPAAYAKNSVHGGCLPCLKALKWKKKKRARACKKAARARKGRGDPPSPPYDDYDSTWRDAWGADPAHLAAGAYADRDGDAATSFGDDGDRWRLPRACGIDVELQIDENEFVYGYVGQSRPVLVRGPMLFHPERELYERWQVDEFLEAHGSVRLPAEAYPYATASADKYGVRQNFTSLRDFYRRGVATAGGRGGDDDWDGSEAPLSIFHNIDGWEVDEAGKENGKARDIRLRRDAYPDGAPGREDPAGLLKDWTRPGFARTTLMDSANIQWYLGPAGTGAQMHFHSHAWNWLVHGRKKWYLLPPRHATYAQRHINAGGLLPPELVRHAITCVQEAGEVVFVPHSWGHATRNLEPSIGWATEFSFDRRFSVEFDEDEEQQGRGGGAAAGWEDGGELPSADDVVIRSPRGGDDMARDAQRDEL